MKDPKINCLCSYEIWDLWFLLLWVSFIFVLFKKIIFFILLIRWVTYRKVREGDAQMMAILCVEGGVVNEIYTATDHVAGGESRSVGLSSTTWAETVSVVTVVTIWMFIPTRKSIYVDAGGWEADAHVTIASLAYDLHLEVIQAAGGRYRVRCANTGSIFVGFAVTWENNTAPTLFKGIGESDDIGIPYCMKI